MNRSKPPRRCSDLDKVRINFMPVEGALLVWSSASNQLFVLKDLSLGSVVTKMWIVKSTQNWEDPCLQAHLELYQITHVLRNPIKSCCSTLPRGVGIHGDVEFIQLRSRSDRRLGVSTKGLSRGSAWSVIILLTKNNQ